MFVLATTGVIALLFPASAVASSSRLEALDGIVALNHDDKTFNEGHDGDLVEQGDVVRTGSGSHAVATFYDSTTVEVEPDSEIVVQTLQATTAGDIVVQMEQTVGRSWHVVSRALAPNSEYEVRTPTATATIRGTASWWASTRRAIRTSRQPRASCTRSRAVKRSKCRLDSKRTSSPAGRRPIPSLRRRHRSR